MGRCCADPETDRPCISGSQSAVEGGRPRLGGMHNQPNGHGWCAALGHLEPAGACQQKQWVDSACQHTRHTVHSQVQGFEFIHRCRGAIPIKRCTLLLCAISLHALVPANLQWHTQMCLPCRLAYPMPPAGADPETWVPEEEPQPIGISINLPPGSILPGANPTAAWLCSLCHIPLFQAALLSVFHS